MRVRRPKPLLVKQLGDCMRRVVIGVLVVGIVGAGVAWVAALPRPLTAASLPAHAADVNNGERIFWLGGCASCHAAKGATGDEKLRLGGGQSFQTAFGTFHATNISPDPETGIGRWNPVDLVNAMRQGVSPAGEHYYPAFPYTSYARMRAEDILDLAGFLKTLPPVKQASRPHDVGFPFNIRQGLGLWKLLYLDHRPIAALNSTDQKVNQGQALAEGAGHCGECHTPRNAIGGADRSRWLAGAPALEGEGRVPNLTPSPAALGEWSAGDIAFYLEFGLTPEGKSAGSTMASVVDNLSRLPAEDRDAIAAYLKAIPRIP